MLEKKSIKKKNLLDLFWPDVSIKSQVIVTL